MSDFSELCPLFSTGVYHEITTGWVCFSGMTVAMNALAGTGTAAAHPGSLKFGRTVVVTKIYGQKKGAATSEIIILAHRRAGTGTAALTAFASLAMSLTDAKEYRPGRIKVFTQTSAKTFLAADVLGFAAKTAVTDAGVYSFIVRFKDK
jgi:hypothetical protein